MIVSPPPGKMILKNDKHLQMSSDAKMQNLVELEKRCKMSIWSQKSASIQLRTDRLKPSAVADRNYASTSPQNARKVSWK